MSLFTPSSKRRRSKGKGRLFRLLLLWLVLPPLLLGVFVLAGVLMAAERTPLVSQSRPAEVEDLLRARDLARTAKKKLSSGETASLAASEADLNGLLTLAAQGSKRFSGRVEVVPGALLAAMTVRLPANPVGKYLNLRMDLHPSKGGVKIENVRLGRLDIPPPVALFLLRRGLDLGLGFGEGAAALESVASVSFKGDSVRVRLRSLPRLRENAKTFARRAAALRDEMAPLGALPVDPQAVRLYHARLKETDHPGEKVSLATYMAPLFRLAKERSADGDPVAENRAALLALAIHLGDHRFAHLVGAADSYPKKGRGVGVVLAGRRDLRLHFVISAGLKLVAEQGAGFAVGEMKELLDSGQGGSGFSFVDLAADRAGVRFAEAATSDPEGARRIQRLLASGAREDLFFPAVADLPENLSQREFEERFGSVGSPAYDLMVREIDARLSRCPAYVSG